VVYQVTLSPQINSKGMNRFVFVDRSSVYVLPVTIASLGIFFLALMELYDSASMNPTPLLSLYKVLFSFGFIMSIFGVFLEQTTIVPIDLYLRGTDYVEFKNFTLVSLIKGLITLVGVIFSLGGLYLEPETPLEQKDGGYYISLVFGGLIGLGLLGQIVIVVRNLYWNRGDFIHVSAITVKWYDNDVKVIKEFPIGDIRFFTKKYEDTDKSPSLEEIHLHLLNGAIERISLKTMSLIPQGDLIISELKKVIAEGKGDAKLN
jgi:hypothetical protein